MSVRNKITSKKSCATRRQPLNLRLLTCTFTVDLGDPTDRTQDLGVSQRSSEAPTFESFPQAFPHFHTLWTTQLWKTLWTTRYPQAVVENLWISCGKAVENPRPVENLWKTPEPVAGGNPFTMGPKIHRAFTNGVNFYGLF